MAGNVSTIQKCKVVLIGDNASSPNASIQYRYPRCPLSQKRMREGEFDGVFDHNQIEVDEGDIIFGMCDSDFPDDKKAIHGMWKKYPTKNLSKQNWLRRQSGESIQD